MCSRSSISFNRYICPSHTKAISSQQCCHIYKDPHPKQYNTEVYLCPSHMSHCGANGSQQCRECWAKQTLSATAGGGGKNYKVGQISFSFSSYPLIPFCTGCSLMVLAYALLCVLVKKMQMHTLSTNISHFVFQNQSLDQCISCGRRCNWTDHSMFNTKISQTTHLHLEHKPRLHQSTINQMFQLLS